MATGWSFGLSVQSWQQRPRIAWVTLGVLLLLTALAHLYVRPAAPARRHPRRCPAFWCGLIRRAIPVRCAHKPDELGQLAATINTMGSDIHQMLDAKRALLLAMSHELRSPLTRARLNAELLPETPWWTRSAKPCCAIWAKWRASLPTCWKASAWPEATPPCTANLWTWPRWRVRWWPSWATATLAPPPLPSMRHRACRPWRWTARMRLLLRNLLDNSLRHTEPGAPPPELRVVLQGNALEIEVRATTAPACRPNTWRSSPRPSTAPTAHASAAPAAWAWGLYLCRLVAQAHGGG